MRLKFLGVIFTATSASSFSVAHNRRRHSFQLRVNVDDIVARAREKAGMPQDEGAPPLFDEDLYGDMQEVLLLLERRVQEGLGSVTVNEIEGLSWRVDRITEDMIFNQHKKSPRPPRQLEEDAPPTIQSPAHPQRMGREFAAEPPSSAQLSPPASLLHADPDAIAQMRAPTEPLPVVDISQDEGPMFDGRGGMGQPKGTVNTYIIPGMDEMTAEEYRDALQRSVSERQARRRASGVVGNRSAEDYLKGLKRKN